MTPYSVSGLMLSVAPPARAMPSLKRPVLSAGHGNTVALSTVGSSSSVNQVAPPSMEYWVLAVT